MVIRLKRFWHLFIAVVAITYFSEQRSWTTPRLALPSAVDGWNLAGFQNCAKPVPAELRILHGARGARQVCSAEYEGSPEMRLTIYDMPGWPGGTAFGTFQGWQAKPGTMAFYKGNYFGVVEAPKADIKTLNRFTIAVEAALPPGAEGHW
jgi:hypothetical protein